MISGEVTPEREAVIRVVVGGNGKQEKELHCVIDTGFSGYLTLSGEDVRQLGLVSWGTSEFMLGNGKIVEFPVYTAPVTWDGERRDIYVLAADGGSLVGMSLLHGNRMTIDIVDGGHLVIEPLNNP